jgi:hypothetical protein
MEDYFQQGKKGLGKNENGLRGCFSRQLGTSTAVGNLALKSFRLRIKCISSSNNTFEHKEQLLLEKWEEIIKFMRKAIKKEPEDPH